MTNELRPTDATLNPDFPAVSVVVPTYNGARFVGATLDSVLAQSFRDFEIIVVDDASEDETRQIVVDRQRRGGKTIRLLAAAQGDRRGIVESYRRGIKAARSEIVAFLEHDDLWVANYLETRVAAFARHPDIGVIVAPYRILTQGWLGIEMRLRQALLKAAIPAGRSYDKFARLLRVNSVATFSCLSVRRTLLTDESPPEDLPPMFFDWWLLTQLSLRTRFVLDGSAYTTWRLHPDSYLRSLDAATLRGRVADYMERTCAHLVADARLDVRQRRMLQRHSTGVAAYVHLLRTPTMDAAWRFWRIDRGWTLMALASLAVNTVKHRQRRS